MSQHNTLVNKKIQQQPVSDKKKKRIKTKTAGLQEGSNDTSRAMKPPNRQCSQSVANCRQRQQEAAATQQENKTAKNKKPGVSYTSRQFVEIVRREVICNLNEPIAADGDLNSKNVLMLKKIT